MPCKTMLYSSPPPSPCNFPISPPFPSRAVLSPQRVTHNTTAGDGGCVSEVCMCVTVWMCVSFWWKLWPKASSYVCMSVFFLSACCSSMNIFVVSSVLFSLYCLILTKEDIEPLSSAVGDFYFWPCAWEVTKIVILTIVSFYHENLFHILSSFLWHSNKFNF